MPRRWITWLVAFAVAAAAGLAGIAGLNYWVDPGHALKPSQYEEKLAEVLRSGQNAAGITNFDDRLLQRYLVEGDWPHRNVITLGSSRSYKWRARHFPDQSFFNHSVNGATVEDYIAISGLYRQKQDWPETVIIGVDPWLFNASLGGGTWQALGDVLAATAGEFTSLVYIERHRQGFRRQRLITLFSLEYAQASVRTLILGNPSAAGGIDFQAIPDDGSTAAIKRADGSYRYRYDPDRTVDTIAREAARLGATGQTFGMENFTERDANLVKLFRDYLEYLKGQGVTVVFFFSPFHPDFYEALPPGSSAARIPLEEAFLRDMARDLNIPTIGSYDPRAVACLREDFIDERHPLESCHDKVLNCRDQSCPAFDPATLSR